jgi:hypothetical protein
LGTAAPRRGRKWGELSEAREGAAGGKGEAPRTRDVGGRGQLSWDVGERGAPRDGRVDEGGGMISRSHSAARARRHARAWAR